MAGIERNIYPSEVKNRGWKRCFHGTYNDTLDSERIINRCTGEHIMYGCREEGNSFWNLVGYGNKTKALTPTTSNNFGTISSVITSSLSQMGIVKLLAHLDFISTAPFDLSF